MTFSVEVPPGVIKAGAKSLLTDGGTETVRVAVFEVAPVPPFVEVMVPVVLL